MADTDDVREWFDRADMDLDSARILMEARYPAPFEVICCLCQQAAEKFLKCAIIYFDTAIIKTHNLVKLVAILAQHVNVPGNVSICAEILTPFAVEVRYPRCPDVDEERTRAAIAEAQEVKDWVKSLVQLDAAKESETASEETEGKGVSATPKSQ